MIRPEAFLAGERAVLEGLLDVQRDEIVAILADLDDTTARIRLVPSLTTPLSLVKHATFAEKIWFHSRVAGRTRAEVGLPETIEESFALEPEDTIASVRAGFLAACEHSRGVAAQHGLDEQFEWRLGPVNLRYIYGHMIAELARHAGHGDILVEQIEDHRRRR
jgi:hypothetical protein